MEVSNENKNKALGAGLGILENVAFQWTMVALLIFALLWLAWSHFAAWYDKTFNSKTEFGAKGFYAHAAAFFGFAVPTGGTIPNANYLNDPAVTIPSISGIQGGNIGSGTVLLPGSNYEQPTDPTSAAASDVVFDPTRGIGTP